MRHFVIGKFFNFIQINCSIFFFFGTLLCANIIWNEEQDTLEKMSMSKSKEEGNFKQFRWKMNRLASSTIALFAQKITVKSNRNSKVNNFNKTWLFFNPFWSHFLTNKEKNVKYLLWLLLNCNQFEMKFDEIRH